MQELSRTIGIPFKPGYDERRVIPDTTGKTYRPSAKRILKRLLNQPGGKVDGTDASRYDVGLFLLVRDMLDTELPQIDRHRAATTVLAYVEGKPVQPVTQRSTVTIQTDEQRRARIAEERAKILAGAARVESAEFSEIPIDENVKNSLHESGESEA